MLICHRHRFIFVKTRKSAGTSVEISLSRYCDGPEDVITPISPRDSRIRETLGVRAKNHSGEGDRKRFHSHARAARIRKKVGDEVWRSYTTFCFVRNPWDRVLSQFCFRHARSRKVAKPSFEQFVREEQFTIELPLYTRDGEVLVDHVLRFEDLDLEMARICGKLDLDWDGWMPRAKSGTRDPGRHYSSAYSPELVAIVARKCAEEIDLHGYSFEGSPGGDAKLFEQEASVGWRAGQNPTRRSLIGLDRAPKTSRMKHRIKSR